MPKSSKVVKVGAKANAKGSAKPTAVASKTQSFPADLLKQLVNTDEAVRTEALSKAAGLLKSKREIPFLEMQKLWKALWYHMWHSDTPLVQQNLARELTDLIQQTNKVNQDAFVKAFWSICTREFEILDRYRINKFYMLTRFYLNAMLTELVKSNNLPKSEAFSTYMVTEGPLSFDNQRYPHTLRMHLIDIYCDELEKAIEGKKVPAKDILVEILNPVLLQATNSKFEHIQSRVQLETINDERLVEWGVVEKKEEVVKPDFDSDEEDDEDEVDEIDDEIDDDEEVNDNDEEVSEAESWAGFD